MFLMNHSRYTIRRFKNAVYVNNLNRRVNIIKNTLYYNVFEIDFMVNYASE